ncbi:MAG: glycosyltransferase [Gammaproteobacteria bacterium]|nr:glycosyltransferase [Gammaproteobacteria bacterium]
MLSAYRCYDVMLNANSVSESPTMFSRRVFEALACATPVVSLESVGMRAMLGEHVRVARTREETAAHLQALLGDDEARVREGHLAYRHVHENHTYRHRVSRMMEEVGVGQVPSTASTVTVLGVVRNPDHLESILADYVAQTYREKELLVVVAKEDFEVESVESRVREVERAEMIRMGSLTFGERLNRAVEEASGAYVAMFDDGDRYCERYIADMMLAADFSGAAVLGKGSYFSYDEARDRVVLRNAGKDHTFVKSVAPSTIVVRREVLRDIPFEVEASGVDGTFPERATKRDLRIYSADRFNYLHVGIGTGRSRPPTSGNGPKDWLLGEGRSLALRRVSL